MVLMKLIVRFLIPLPIVVAQLSTTPHTRDIDTNATHQFMRHHLRAGRTFAAMHVARFSWNRLMIRSSIEMTQAKMEIRISERVIPD